MTALSFLESLVEPNQIKLRAIHASFSDQQYQSAQIPLSTFSILQSTALLFLSLVEVLWIFWAGLCSGIENTRAGPVQRQLFDAWAPPQTCFWKGKEGHWRLSLLSPSAMGTLSGTVHNCKEHTLRRNFSTDTYLTQEGKQWRKSSVFLRIWNIYAYKSPSKVWCPSSNSQLLSFLFSNYKERNAGKSHVQCKLHPN